jgi:amidase
MAFAASVSEADVRAARDIHTQARAQIGALVPTGRALVIPTAPCIAPRLDTPAQELDAMRVRVMRLTCIAGLSGLPQVTLPVGLVENCPVGLSLIGWAGGDEALLDLAVRLGRYCGVSA